MSRRFSSIKGDLLAVVQLFVLAVIAAVTWDCIQGYIAEKKAAPRIAAMNSLAHVEQIVLACKEYAIDNDGNFPPSLDALFPTYFSKKERAFLVSPLNPADPVGYIYTPGLKDAPPSDTIVIEDKFAPSIIHKRIVVYKDGRGRMILSGT